MKTGIKYNGGPNEHGMKLYSKKLKDETLYTYAMNIKAAALHFRTNTNVF